MGQNKKEDSVQKEKEKIESQVISVCMQNSSGITSNQVVKMEA
jgi:hypothetical protein